MHEIKEIQRKFNLPVTNILDELTIAAIRNFQLKNNMVASGRITEELKEKLGIGEEGNLDTDQIQEIPIKKYFLPKGEFLQGPTKKESLFLHHTAGYNNPFSQVDIWARDPQGPIGTQYVIGGPHPVTGDVKHDGEIVQCFNDENYAWHLTIGNTEVHRNSVGIELCNFGWVTKGGFKNILNKQWISKNPDSFYSWSGTRMDPGQIVDLGFEFRGYRYFHKYSEAQLYSLKFLIKSVGEKLGINIYSGIYQRLKTNDRPDQAFFYWSDAKFGRIKGMFTHSNVVEIGKWDLCPQPGLIDMIRSL